MSLALNRINDPMNDRMNDFFNFTTYKKTGVIFAIHT